MNEEIKDVKTHEGRGREEENGKRERRKEKKQRKEKKKKGEGYPILGFILQLTKTHECTLLQLKSSSDEGLTWKVRKHCHSPQGQRTYS